MAALNSARSSTNQPYLIVCQYVTTYQAEADLQQTHDPIILDKQLRSPERTPSIPYHHRHPHHHGQRKHPPPTPPTHGTPELTQLGPAPPKMCNYAPLLETYTCGHWNPGVLRNRCVPMMNNLISGRQAITCPPIPHANPHP
ncbi:hypothetical protein B0A54_13044 [Friedmanniomyces endolithicus]|uniref:Uncharacterized protein n=1 Tax=Friedmanniomyces endolithicus TaxID=329885 RepID=A0A4U0UMS3_9PEZI|nr:hypothetical protein B0A54_13044 [Friedmanniomyces endolithicus]